MLVTDQLCDTADLNLVGRSYQSKCLYCRNVVARFICKQLQILQHPDIQLTNCKYLAEYFSFLFEFARMGGEEKRFLRENNCISIMITFYVGEPERRNSNSSQVSAVCVYSLRLELSVQL